MTGRTRSTLTQACRHQTAIVTRIRQIDSFTLEHSLGQHLRHSLRIRGASDLLKLQPHLGNTGQPGLETEITVATGPLFTLHQTHQRSKHAIERTFRALCLFNKLSGIFF